MSDSFVHLHAHTEYSMLDGMGFSLAQLATAIGYPQAALRAFRSGVLDTDETTFDDIRLKLHDIAVMTARIGRHRGKTGGRVEEAALFEARLVEGYTATGWDLYTPMDGARCARTTRGHDREAYPSLGHVRPGHSALCMLAEGTPAEQVLDRYIPDWRERFWTAFKTVLASDGNPSIVAKGRDER